MTRLHEFYWTARLSCLVSVVTDVLSYSVQSLQDRLPFEFILRFTTRVSQGLEYLHDEYGTVYSGAFLVFLVDTITLMIRLIFL